MATRTDISGLQRQVRAVQRAAPHVARDALGVLVQEGVEWLVRESPKDTNRYASAWQRARNQALGVSQPVLAIKDSMRSGMIRKRLQDQLARATLRKERLEAVIQEMGRKNEAWYVSAGRNDRSARAYERKLRQMEKYKFNAEIVEIRAREQIEAYWSGAIVIGGRKVGKKGVFGVSNLATVRKQIYGGTGSIVPMPDRVMVIMQNLEPHARIVESRTRLVSRMSAAFKKLGARRVNLPQIIKDNMAARLGPLALGKGR